MDYREMFQEENQEITERYLLTSERIAQIAEEPAVFEEYCDYFSKTAAFILRMGELFRSLSEEEWMSRSLKELQTRNKQLYIELEADNYKTSYANPSYSVAKLGAYGSILAMLYREIRGMIVYVYEARLNMITILSELFIEIYNCFEIDDMPDMKEIRDIMYWFFSDYSDEMIEFRVREQLDTALDFAVRIVMDSDLSDIRYLYRYGECVSESEIQLANFLNSLDEDTIEKMAAAYTEGYRIGFEKAGKDLAKKEIVNIRYHIGFERVIRAAINNFREMGLRPSIYRRSVTCIHSAIGYEGAFVNRQYEYDHRNDRALFLDKAYVERRLGAIKAAYEKYRKEAARFAGPACVEVFGESPFAPEVKEACLSLDKIQQGLAVRLANESGRIMNEYIHGDERSFTIIAFPMPDIGERFEEIFREVIRINTLDYKMYEKIQQYLIDALDEGETVHIRGKGDNKTNLSVSLYPLSDPKTETDFENCVADVNIPVGEVFTSPVLKGTSGILHVTSVYLNELKYENLMIHFEDGMVTDYSCTNFDSEEENRRFIRENVLYHHDTLPIGEFAIGTNTTAYVMAQKYGINDKLPILIAEKLGPHFALGDTCYSWEEDTPVYNPDGKEIIARDNEISVLRREDISKAYFNCHTDITIPYDELGFIEAVRKDGTKRLIIQDGRFVLEGTAPLNEPFN